MYDASDLRKNLKIEIDGEPYVVTKFEFSKPGKGQSLYRCKLKNMLTGNTMDKTYRSADKIERADLISRKFTYSYNDGVDYVFMDNETYAQCHLRPDQLGQQAAFLNDNMEIDILFHNEHPLEVTLPNFVEKEITFTAPGVKGDTATNSTKSAKIEGNYEIEVPLFINQGDLVSIDTRTGEYSERISKG